MELLGTSRCFPAFVMTVVSHVAICPSCWPFVGGLMVYSGLASFIEGPLMLPTFIGSILLALIPLGLEARRRVGPFLIGLIASFFALSGKLVFNPPGAALSGAGLLVGAYVWSYAFRSRSKGKRCSANCAAPTEAEQIFSNSASDVSIACALDRTRFAERKKLIDQIAGVAIERKSISNGLALGFAPRPGLVSKLAEFVELERVCCPFLSFKMDVTTRGNVWLELTGPAASQRIIRELIFA